jgi:ABC-2 type transport system ATP-binding protein
MIGMTTADTAPATRPREHADRPAAVRMTGLSKHFGPVQAVRGLDPAIQPGEIVAFLGPNGAGKTSTIDMILGLSRPSSGEVTVYGIEPHRAIARGLVSAVMQTGGLPKDLTVAETLRLIRSLFCDTRSLDEVLEWAGISQIADRRVGKLSGGQQQRLRFAMALLPDPRAADPR